MRILCSLALFLSIGPTANADSGVRSADESEAAEDTAKSPKEKKSKKKKKKGEEDETSGFDATIAGKTHIEGLFDFYRDDETGQTWVAITPEQLDTDYLLSMKTDRAVGERGLYGTIMADSFVFQWRTFRKRVQLVRRSLSFRADPGSPEERAMARSFTDSVLASVEPASEPHPETGAVLVDVGQVFTSSDFTGMASWLGVLYQGGYGVDADNSGVEEVDSFESNSELGLRIRFAGEVEGGSVALPDVRSMDIGYRLSMVALPEDDDYVPRFADDRVGYFTTPYIDFSDTGGDVPYVHLINRWKLQKKDPDAALSEPVEPIVFWLENTVPERYRASMMEGVLVWNKAFEAAGFKDAVVVKQMPDDAEWNPADARYNTIRWFLTYDASFAIGPSHADPRTGRLLDADIGFSDGIARFGAVGRHRYWVDPVQALEEMGTPAPVDGQHTCSYGQTLADQAAFATGVLASRQAWSSEDEERFVTEYMREVTAHEVGHTLGLRHNFIASIIHSTDTVLDWDLDHLETATSVMDYNPPVVAPKGRKQGPYLPGDVGSYDIFAVRYGYTPVPGATHPEDEREALAAIAREGTKAGHAYATDEDAGFWGAALDPRVTRFDFSADPIAWYEENIALVRELWGNLDSLVADGESYVAMRNAMNMSWRNVVSGGMVAAKHVGGVYHHRHHKGDPDAELPFVPVPAAEQRRALQFMADELWAPGVWSDAEQALDKLQFERHVDLEGTVFMTSRLDYPIHEMVATAQSMPLEILLQYGRLARLADLEKMHDDALSVDELFSILRANIWTELNRGSTIDSYRRSLQMAHLDRMLSIALERRAAPEDAVALARDELKQIRRGANLAAPRMRDRTSRAHLENVRDRIDAALDASFEL